MERLGGRAKGLVVSWKRLVRLFELYGSLLEALGGLLEPLQSSLSVLEPSWSQLGALLEASWSLLKPSLMQSGQKRHMFKNKWCSLFWGALAALGGSWRPLGASCKPP